MKTTPFQYEGTVEEEHLNENDELRYMQSVEFLRQLAERTFLLLDTSIQNDRQRRMLKSLIDEFYINTAYRTSCLFGVSKSIKHGPGTYPRLDFKGDDIQ